MSISVPLSAFGQQAFVDIAFDIGLHAGPVFGVDQLDDQAAERGGVLDILPRLFEDRPEHPGLAAQFIENLAVVSFEFFAVALQQAGPAEFGGHDRFAVVRRPRLLVGHFQKEQKSDLLGVSHVGKPIIAQFVVPALAGSQRTPRERVLRTTKQLSHHPLKHLWLPKLRRSLPKVLAALRVAVQRQES